jgi:AmmeMemoRadiSam system protein B
LLNGEVLCTTKMKNRLLNFFYLVLVILVASQLFLIYKINFPQLKNNQSYEGKLINQNNLPTHSSYFSSKDYYEEAFLLGEEEKINADKKVYGGILPHHLIVKEKIAAFLSGLEKYDYENIVLVGPNHFLKGGTAITSQASWQTPYGDLLPNLELIEKLSGQEEVVINEDPFKIEHSISGLVGFIKKTFTEAKLTPLILRPSADSEACASLVDIIINNTQKEKNFNSF